MADKKKKTKIDKVVVAEFKVSMHCNACERSVAKAISRIKGVEKFVTDIRNHKVAVTGKINPLKVAKKVKKKTGKKVEIVDIDKEDGKKEEGNLALEQNEKQIAYSLIFDHYCEDSELHMMFSDENANACSIM
ncbi:heavy metal-associated isoprenylated plant 19 [Olea europaea subsp. europaea]|uniref:Heavy metal-associated isoprenylated plant 19 n=1 Tax=Olea europaea subsp. europaea TaxID=158383 RepID=A0A8S0S1K8_OLEEU|nr:heavy metal-associated isoprenylated plant 19 [Olea europaea subsp. europaea]